MNSLSDLLSNGIIEHLSTFQLKPDSDVQFLILASGDDRQVDPTVHEKFRCLQPKSVQKNVEIIHYNSAGHLLEPPYSPYCFTSYHKAFGEFDIFAFIF